MSCSPFRVPIARLAAAQAVLAIDAKKAAASLRIAPGLGRLAGRGARRRSCRARRGTVQAMAIPDEDVAQVRAATDIVALIGEYTPR